MGESDDKSFAGGKTRKKKRKNKTKHTSKLFSFFLQAPAMNYEQGSI